MKKYFVLLSVVMAMGSVVGLAQNKLVDLFVISGTVVDSLSDEALPYTTVAVAKSQTPNQFIKAVASGDDGTFEMQLNEPGDYVMSIQLVGSTTVVKPFTLTESEKKMDFGKVYVQESRAIDEAIIIAQKPLVKVEIDKIVYSMENDPESKVNSTLEMLRKVPLVTVDGEENVQLKGSSNFKIYLNGRPSNMLSGRNVSQVLKSMPANSVKSIEVITDPGARYDAEGIGGIINIVTSRNAFQGYQGSVSVNAGTHGDYGAGAYLTAKVGKLGLTGNFNYIKNKSPWSDSESMSSNLINNLYHQETSIGRNKNSTIYVFGHLEASYEFDTLNLLSIGVDLMNGNSKSITERAIEMRDINNIFVYGYDRNGEGKYNYGYTGVNVDYQRATRKKGELFTLSYRFNNSPDGSESYSYASNVLGAPPSHIRLNQWADNEAKTREHTGQLDYINPLNKNHSVEGGVKYILRENISNVMQHEMDSLGR